MTYAGGNVKVEPFEKELHSTVFVPGPIAILDLSKLDEFVIDDVEMMACASGQILDKKKLDDYLESSGLYFCNDNDSDAVFLEIGKQCHIIPIN